MPAELAIDSREEPPDKLSGDRSRAKSLSRSRSRARTNPSELLARRQQLLTASTTGDELAAADSLRGLDSSSGYQQHDEADSQRLSHVEARLESLSELLKSHETNNGHHQQAGYTAASSKSIEDVYILLAKKEKDLQLAAELGKALLEKNDQLSKANEHITEDYSHKLELLEQDKHKLKRQINLLNAEFENKLIELQTDCNILKNQLEEQQKVFRKKEKEKSKLIDDLVQQNQRLTSELLEATKSEELLSRQLEKVNEHSSGRMSGGRDQVAHLDTLKEEIQVVNQRKQDLERRLKLAQKDRSSMGAALDESGDKILLLENLLSEKEARLGELEAELLEIRDTGSWMSRELETMVSLNERLCNSAIAASGGGQEAANGGMGELLDSERKRSQLIEQLRELRLKSKSRLKAMEFRHKGQRANQLLLDGQQQPAGRRRAWRKSPATGNSRRGHRSLKDELERRPVAGGGSLSGSLSSSSSSLLGQQEEPSLDDSSQASANQDQLLHHLDWTPEAATEIYAMLHKFHTALQSRRQSLDRLQAAGRGHLAASEKPLGLGESAPEGQVDEAGQSGGGDESGFQLYSRAADDSGISADDVDPSSKQALSLVGGPEARTTSRKAVNPVPWRKLLGSLQALIEEMPCTNCQLMIKERADYDLLQRLHARLSDEVRLKSEQVLSLSALKTEHEAKLVALEERCQLLSQDLKNCDMPKEEIVKLAWRARDEAVERKNAAEISLAKTRIENMQISSQLMEVVQQKGELSLKLAQFEDDIHYITQHSVKAKFTWEEYAEKLRRSKARQAETSSASSNPLAQLLSGFSSVASARNSSLASGNSLQLLSAPGNADKSSAMAMDNASQQPQQQHQPPPAQASSLMRNFTSNRFNLRFWQRNSSEKQPPNAGLPVGSQQTTTTTTSSSSSSSSITLTPTTTTTSTTTPSIQ